MYKYLISGCIIGYEGASRMFGDLQFAVINQIILRFAMIDRVLNMAPVQQDSYYFQLIPISLSIVKNQSELPANGTTYRFTVSKGQQKFDENKIPVEANFQPVGQRRAMVINTCRLNFYLPNYSKLRKQDFSFVVVQREHNQDYELGEYKIVTDDLVTQFKENNKGRFEYKVNFSEDYELQFQIYVEKNRMALERNIRENKTQRINKSPLRGRKEERVESPKKVFSPRQEENVTPSRDNEQEHPAPQPTATVQQEEKVEVVAQVVEEKVEPTPEPVVQAPRSYAPSERQAASSRVANPPAEKSVKDDTQSRKTGQNVPLLATKTKQLSRGDTPAEVNLEASMRLSSIKQPAPKPATNDELKEKILLSVFLAFSFVIMYLAMHPNKKV